MNNSPKVSPRSPVVLRGIVTVCAILVVVVVATVLILGKGANQKKDLRRAILTRNHDALGRLLKTYPGLANADLPHTGRKGTWSPIHMAACLSDPETIEILTRHKAKVNARDSAGLTPLHYTVAQGRYDCAEMLINKSADINAKGRDGRTPLDLAKNLRDRRMIELFRVLGAKE